MCFYSSKIPNFLFFPTLILWFVDQKNFYSDTFGKQGHFKESCKKEIFAADTFFKDVHFPHITVWKQTL